MFGFLGLEAICSSRRLKGLAELMHSAKAPLKQALVLTVGQVMFLHGKLAEPSCNHVDRAIVAYLLIALYGRCRHSDLQNVEDVILDFGPEGGFMEITTKTHKTARTVAQKTKLLPVVIPAVGINGSEWISEAKGALEEYGLKLEGRCSDPQGHRVSLIAREESPRQRSPASCASCLRMRHRSRRIQGCHLTR